MPGLFAGTALERPVTCEVCEQPLERCTCPRNADGEVTLPAAQRVDVRVERRKRGKTVTVVDGLDPVASDLKAMVQDLRKACGAGGTIAETRIEIQGEHRDHVIAYLAERGYRTRSR